MKKIYTAFISSAYESLLDERALIIDALLDFRILPIGMEHFTVSTSDEFKAIQELIDDSDFFIMLLGKSYGTIDEKDPLGRSWTHREFDYAQEIDKPTIVILCDELIANMKKDPTCLSEDEKQQLIFAKSISYARAVSNSLTIPTIINQFLHTYDFDRCVGWKRPKTTHLNKAFDIGGTWYHVHLSEEDPTYIRTGTVNIDQVFKPDTFQSFIIRGTNYNIAFYDPLSGFHENKMKNTQFSGDYTLGKEGMITGIFHSKRSFKSEFGGTVVEKGERRGIHDFTLDPSADYTSFIEGEFHDEAPSPKHGRIFLFRDKAERDTFLLENRLDYIQVKER